MPAPFKLTRIASHMWSIGFLLNDLGAFFTPALYAIEERELILDLFEWAAGSRMMCNYFRFGGVAFDLPPGWIERCRGDVNERLNKRIDELDRYLSKNEIVLDRGKGVGVLTREQAIEFSTAGPVLRASGVAYDIRRAAPTASTSRFEFRVVTAKNGDLYDRYYVRLEEMRRRASRSSKQALARAAGGAILPGKKTYQIRCRRAGAIRGLRTPRGSWATTWSPTARPRPTATTSAARASST
jgi:NADH:ubiquinone oxidoreductase subunit D